MNDITFGEFLPKILGQNSLQNCPQEILEKMSSKKMSEIAAENPPAFFMMLWGILIQKQMENIAQVFRELGVEVPEGWPPTYGNCFPKDA